MLKKLILFSLSIFIVTTAIATPKNSSFTAGKDYKVIVPAHNMPKPDFPKNKVTVIEFFSYGCPWCFQLEKSMEAWEKQKPTYVVFERVPVTFEPSWDLYAKAYYVAKALKIEPTVTPAIFHAIHRENLHLDSAHALQRFFVSKGVDAKQFDAYFHYSPSIELEVAKAPKLMSQYQVFSVPTVVINGKYRLDMRTAGGDKKRFISILNFLVEKEYQAMPTKHLKKTKKSKKS